MTEREQQGDPTGPERNPMGLGPRDREGSNTGSTADTSYDAEGADRYPSGEPRKDYTAPSRPADPDAPGSDEP